MISVLFLLNSLHEFHDRLDRFDINENLQLMLGKCCYARTLLYRKILMVIFSFLTTLIAIEKSNYNVLPRISGHDCSL